MEPGVFEQDGELVIGAIQADRVCPADFGEAFASRLLCAEDEAAVDDLSRCGVFDLFEAHVHSELTPELDLDVADVAWLIDSPGDRGDREQWAGP